MFGFGRMRIRLEILTVNLQMYNRTSDSAEFENHHDSCPRPKNFLSIQREKSVDPKKHKFRILKIFNDKILENLHSSLQFGQSILVKSSS